MIDLAAAGRTGARPTATGAGISLRRSFILGTLFALSLALLLLSLTSGASGASISNLFKAALAGQLNTASPDWIVIVGIRLPRALMAWLAGASLAVSGALMQGLFRNPLADPGVVGVSSGAALGAAAMIVLGAPLIAWAGSAGTLLLPLAAFAGGIAVTALLQLLSSRNGAGATATLLVAGLAIAALGGALTGLLVFVADDNQLRDLSFWTLGSLSGASWQKVSIAASLMLPVLALSMPLARRLNAMALGESTAYHLGIPVEATRLATTMAVALLTGTAVALCGGIGFVGIVVPHILRQTLGPDHRLLLPASVFLGASLMQGADAICRIIVAPAELPIGILTALIGAPTFLWVLLSGRGAGFGGMRP